MTMTKSQTTIVTPGTSVSAGNTNTSSADGGTGYELSVAMKITNGGTGPTTQCVGTLNGSGDNSNWYLIGQIPGGTAANGVTSQIFPVPGGTRYVQTVFTGHTGQAVTIDGLLFMTIQL